MGGLCIRRLTQRAASVCACAALVVAARDALAVGDPPPSGPRIVAMTVPSKMATLAPVLSARIGRMEAAEGALVARGDVVVSLENSVQRSRTEMARMDAASTFEADLAHVRWRRAESEERRIAALYGANDSSPKELVDARAALEITRLEYDLAKAKRARAQVAYERERDLLAEYSLRAPFSGYVVEHLKRPGETLDPLEGVITIARLDPLQVWLDCPLDLASSIGVGDRFDVEPAARLGEPRVGTVVFASRVADGASQTFRVKVEVANADRGWMAGMKVTVDLTPTHAGKRASSAEEGVAGLARGVVRVAGESKVVQPR